MKQWTSLAILFALTFSIHAEKQLVLNVWPGKVPGIVPEGKEHATKPRPGQKKVIRLTNVSKPTLTVFRPKNANGASVMVCPGGGYHILAWDLEGTEVAEWLNSIGVTAFVLKYRVPRPKGSGRSNPPLGPFQDAQRALSLIRSRAKEWKLDPNRIGMLGFSAGGHLTARTSTNFDKRSYKPIDDVDKQSCRPDFSVLIYPAYLVKKGSLELMPTIRPSAKSPPMFFAHAKNDPISSENSVGLSQALKKLNIPTEVNLYEKGGHGFGLRPSRFPCSKWPQRCAKWLKKQGILKN